MVEFKFRRQVLKSVDPVGGNTVIRRGRMRSALGAALGLALLGLCNTGLLAAGEREILLERNRIREVGRDALATLYEIQPSARHAIEHSAGYGVFSAFAVREFFAGGAAGKGYVYNNRTKRYTFMRMAQARGAPKLEPSRDRVVWVFETHNALARFISAGWDFGGKAPEAAVVQDPGNMFHGAVSVAPGLYLYQLLTPGAPPLRVIATRYFRDGELN